jgi:prepilin signal peptidase PulO-like enzyme (type II secretory pathway)
VLGWLWLGGRCRDCRSPISAAYPAVEAACGLLVGAVAVSELVCGGGIDRVVFRGDWRPVFSWAWHSGLLLALLAWALLLRSGRIDP